MKGPADLTADNLGSLGPAIRNTPPAPAPIPVAPGIVRDADGRLSTNAAPPPPPPPAPVYDWPYGVIGIYDEQCED